VPVLPLPLTGWAAAKPANPHTAMATSVDRRVMFTVQEDYKIHRVWECEGFYMAVCETRQACYGTAAARCRPYILYHTMARMAMLRPRETRTATMHIVA
jgi:hypothetical protein